MLIFKAHYVAKVISKLRKRFILIDFVIIINVEYSLLLLLCSYHIMDYTFGNLKKKIYCT